MNLDTVLLERGSLQSRVIRELVGERVLDLTEDIRPISIGSGTIFSQIFNIAKKLTGFLAKAALLIIDWKLVDLWEAAVETYFELKYFDWNQTDTDLEAKLKANDDAMAGALGSLAGTSLVWLTGIGVSLGLSFKFPVLSGKMALELAEEGGSEIRAAVTNLITVARQNAVRSALYGGLLTARRLEFLGLKPVTKNTKPWSFAEGIDNITKFLPTTWIQAFFERFVDSVEDSIIEMGYVVAYTLDDFYLSQRAVQNSQLGQERTVELTPDIRVEDERIIIEAPQELAVNTIQTVTAGHQLIHNRDVGQIAGMPERDYVTPVPQRRKLTIIFRSKKTPPWKLENGETAKTVELNIPDVKQGLTWQKLKTTIKAFTWGKYQVTAHLDNGRQMRAFGVSFTEAEKQLNEAIKLSTATITRFHHGVTATDDPNPNNRKVPTVVYPAYAKLTVGDVRANGTLRSSRKEKYRVDLWVTEEPENSTNLN